MPNEERRGQHGPREPIAPLPPDLAAFLRDQPLACLMQPTDHGTAFVLKAPGAVIRGIRGRVPIGLRHELYEHPAAPVIRTVLTIYDRPATPLALETFTNVGEQDQRADFAALAEQTEFLLLCYDESLTHQLTKRVGHPGQEATIRELVERADALRAAIPDGRYDFDRAKQSVIEATSL